MKVKRYKFEVRGMVRLRLHTNSDYFGQSSHFAIKVFMYAKLFSYGVARRSSLERKLASTQR